MAKKGYTKIDNEILESLYSSDLNGSDIKVLLFIIRFTLGFGRVTCKASNTYIANGIGCCSDTVKKALKRLIAKEIVKIEYENIGSSAKILKLNLKAFQGALGGQISYENRPPSWGSNVTHDGGQTSPLKGGQTSPQEIKEEIKELNKKEEKKIILFINDFDAVQAREIMSEMDNETRDKFIKGEIGVSI